MDKNKLLSYLRSKKSKDYTYTIAFFIVFTFFLFALIRPNIIEIFSSYEKIKQMKEVNSFYEREIVKSFDLQNEMETIGSEVYLLNEAIPSFPRINKLLDDFKLALEKYNLKIEKLNIADISLRNPSKGKKESVQVDLILNGDFDEFRSFMKDVHNQRRVKLIREIVVSRPEERKSASQSATLRMELKIDGYYL
jgi:Tfp pilus assembly protein PilO